jgi:hypothetical protein
MNRVGNIVMIFIAVLAMSGIAAGQKRARPKPKPAPPPAPAAVSAPAPAKRPVTVQLKQGDPVTGNFVRADAETVQIDVRSGRLTIRMSDVASLIFTDEVEPEDGAVEETSKAQAAPDPNPPAARKAYAALTKMADAAKIKLPYGQYGSLLIDVRQVVEESLVVLPDSALKIEIVRAMETYTDAGLAWGAAQLNGRIPISSDPGASLMRKYDIKPGINQLGQADHLEINLALKTIWAVANARLNNVAVLLRQ